MAVPDATLADLRDRLARTRFFDDFEGSDWNYGVSRTYLEELCEYWRTTFDWRAQEAIINSFDQFQTHIDRQPIHFIHACSTKPPALPLLLVHGWPGSIFEFMKVIGPLSDPAAYGGDEADAFHVVAPSIPGYGFSGPTIEPGWGPARIASAFATLMGDLGYERYGAGGGDWGAIITTELARADTGLHICGLHLTMPLGEPPGDADGDDLLTESDRKGLEDWAAHQANGTVVHVPINSTRPHTLAFALNDSPAGLAAWLVDKFRSYSDCDGDVESSFTKDELLAEITTYWVTGTIASASRLYYERAHERNLTKDGPYRIEVPTGCAIFPRDVRRVPRPWAERLYNIKRWAEMPSGGHFAGLEEPELLVAELRTFFRPLRERLGG
ncbi:MAG: epoxide hydrolase [Actinomycetota bacterium]|nr:epoxide hydrolase [Actinomycetota bacterium]